MSPEASPARDAAGWLADRVAALERFLTNLSAVEFLLIAVAVAAAYWICWTVRDLTRLGPIEVKPLVRDGAASGSGEATALTALLRECLANSGLLPPPEVPAGSPQTDVISAVETSGHPQAGWAAALLTLLPHPPRSPEYVLHGTLFTPEGTTAYKHGLRYWLQPKSNGRPKLGSVTGATEESVVELAAADIFLSISADAVHVFPEWSRWQHRGAFIHYLQGIGKRVEHDDGAAGQHFREARAAEPRNLIVRLQLANMREKRATDDPAEQAKLLRSYLDIGVSSPSLVWARYRASIVAGMLASAYRPSSGLVDDPVKEELEPIFGKDTAIVQGLRTLADDESRATKRLLAPLHVLIYERRLRHRYEPTGVARRQLRRSVAISRHALAVSEMGVLHSWSSDSAWVRLRIWTRRAAVRGRHLGLSTLSSGWNAHYNAACFYALLHDRKATGENLDSKELRTLRRRAYEELNTAIDKAGPELDLGWLTKDPDLKKLRELGEPEWRVLLRRHGGTSGATDPLLPEAPGGSPERRRNTSLAFGVTSLALAVLSAIFVQFPSVLAVGVVVALVIGGVVCLSHARVLGRNAAARRDRSRTLRTGTP